jgi:hypothetical protein
MKLTVTRVDNEGRYKTVIARDDGVRFHIAGVGHNFAIPHDVAHFVGEKALRLTRGFWGSVADGAVFPTMIHIDGRRKPKAAERSKELLKDNARQLNEAEVLVRIFNDTIEQGHQESSQVLRRRLEERFVTTGRQPREVSKSEISEIFAEYQELLSKWRDLPAGSSMDLFWKS